jgi:lambda family phage portal protein
MGFFDRFTGPKAATETQETKWRGASRVIRSLASWVTSPGSATSDLPAGEQRTLRARSRDAFRSHLIARAALTRPRTNIVGTGLMCRPAVDHVALGISEEEAETINTQISSRFVPWAEDPVQCDWEATNDFYGLQSLSLLSAMLSGDVMGLTPQQERSVGIASLKVQLIEADRISNPDDSVDTPSLVDGIVLQNGVPVACWIRNTHPGDQLTAVNLPKWTRYEMFGGETGRRRVLHVWNDKERPGQVRGAPYLAPILEPLVQLQRYGSAELMAAVVSAMFTVFIEKGNEQFDADGNPIPAFGEVSQTDTAAAPQIALGNGAIVDLAPGEKANTANPTRPNVNFDPFFVSVVKQIGAALELPLDELMLHYQSSYSAARAAMLQAWRFYTMRRWWLVQQFCQPVYGLWMDEEVASGRLNLPGYADPMKRRAYARALWIGPSRGAMDEEKEAKAAKMRIEIGVSNEAIETASMTGEDWATVHAQRVREIEAKRKSERLDPEKYGASVRAGLVTPNLDDEEAFRKTAGLPAANNAVRSAWDEDKGVRRPITLQADSPPATQPGTTKENES